MKRSQQAQEATVRMEAMEGIHYLVFWRPAQGQRYPEKSCCDWGKKFSDSQCPSTDLIRLLHLVTPVVILRAIPLKKGTPWTLLLDDHILCCHWLAFEFTWGKPITNCSFVCYWDTHSPRHRLQVRVEWHDTHLSWICLLVWSKTVLACWRILNKISEITTIAKNTEQ